MMKRRNKKRRRQIELLLKLNIFIIFACIMVLFVKPNTKDTSIAKDTVSAHSTESNFEPIRIPSELRIPFHGLSQSEIPTGCESVSTVAVLQHYQIQISIDEFISAYLPCDTFYWKDNKLYGPDPREFFVGNPYSKSSLGCYPDVIMKALKKMKNKGYPGMDELSFQKVTDSNLDALVTEYVAKQIPVILWITIGMKEPYDGMQYYLENGSLYTWKAQEHCAVLCGYDEESYYIMDPLADGEIIAYPKDLVEKRYEEMGRNAIVISNLL